MMSHPKGLVNLALTKASLERVESGSCTKIFYTIYIHKFGKYQPKNKKLGQIQFFSYRIIFKKNSKKNLLKYFPPNPKLCLDPTSLTTMLPVRSPKVTFQTSNCSTSALLSNSISYSTHYRSRFHLFTRSLAFLFLLNGNE